MQRAVNRTSREWAAEVFAPVRAPAVAGAWELAPQLEAEVWAGTKPRAVCTQPLVARQALARPVASAVQPERVQLHLILAQDERRSLFEPEQVAEMEAVVARRSAA